MAKLIKVNGEITEVAPASAKAGFTCDELYALIGCDMIECVYLADGSMLVIDEEGKETHAPFVNFAATRIAANGSNHFGTDYVAGNAVLCNGEELK